MWPIETAYAGSLTPIHLEFSAMAHRHVWLLTGLLAAMIVGCGGSGPATVSVSGSVTVDGEPVPEGTIYFRDQDGGNSYAGKIRDGQYEAKVTPGGKTVEIIGYREVPGKVREDNPGEKTPVRQMYIPKQYNRESTLQLELPTNPNKQQEDFDLKTDA